MKPPSPTKVMGRWAAWCGALILLGIMYVEGCGNDTSGTSHTQALDANTTIVTTVPTAYGGTCNKLSRDTSSCQGARTALGLSGDWLNFSCNVTLGLATAAGVATTSLASASFVTISTPDLPDTPSNYFPTTGTYSFSAYGLTIAGNFSDMYKAYTTSFPDPGTIGAQSVTMNIPLAPAFNGAQTMSGGAVGVAINGVLIFSSIAAATDNIFAEAGSFDQCQGHPAGTTYHYHSEPYAISYNDNGLIGVMRDGFFIYGRKDYSGSTPGSIANLQTQGTASTLYKYGGHTGTDPLTNTGNTFHYHLTEWKGCFDETGPGGAKYGDDGQSGDTLNSPAGTCNVGATAAWVDTWFMTGRGLGGAFATLPGGLNGQSPSQVSNLGVRYFYGTPGSCTGC